MLAKKWFEGRTLIIATKHRKEAVIAPILERELGVRCVIPFHFDTDQFGTFSGEIHREWDPIATVRKKCHAAMQVYGADLAVASEGSFGAHPSFGLLPCDDELMLLVDHKNGLEIFERELSLDTNLNQLETGDEDELLAFAENCGFPQHGLILRSPADNALIKGITDRETLLTGFRQMRRKATTIGVETDMRALFNPTRMQVIEKATLKLAARLLESCPKCQSPGFGIADAISGKPCGACGLPTKSTRSYMYCCPSCNYSEERRKSGSPVEDPAFCDYCNP